MIEIIETTPGNWILVVNRSVIASSREEGVVKRMARIFEGCRNMPYRSAIKSLIDEIGFGEESAKIIYGELFAHRSSTTLN